MTEQDTLKALQNVIRQRISDADAEDSYVARLVSTGQNAILKKIGEEATETVMAGKDNDDGQLVYEMADLWFHCLVMLAQ